MTEKSDSARLVEIEARANHRVEIGKFYFIDPQDSSWLISSLRLAWAQNEVMKDALNRLAPCFRTKLQCELTGMLTEDAQDQMMKWIDDALKRCEELKSDDLEDHALLQMAKEIGE